jgi:hypothetical protein
MEKPMTDNNNLLRRSSIITEEEVLVITGDLYVAENAITRERRILDKERVSSVLSTTNINESTTSKQLLKG